MIFLNLPTFNFEMGKSMKFTHHIRCNYVQNHRVSCSARHLLFVARAGERGVGILFAVCAGKLLAAFKGKSFGSMFSESSACPACPVEYEVHSFWVAPGDGTGVRDLDEDLG